MALDSSNVIVTGTGVISVGTSASTPPTGPDDPLDSTWVDLGYASEDGVKEAREWATTDIKAGQMAAIVRQVVTDASVTQAFKLIETKKEVIELFYGTTLDAAGRVVVVPSLTGGRRPFVLDFIDTGTGEFIRAHVPAGEITKIDEQTYAGGDAVGYGITIQAYPVPTLIDPETGQVGCIEKWYASQATP